jgi:autotransporter family porin
VLTGGSSSPISVINSGYIATSHGPGLFGHGVYGVYARTNGADSPIAIMNSGKIDPDIGIGVRTTGADSPIIVDNSGDVYGSNVGIRASSLTNTTIVNTGTISAGTNFAIGVYAGPATIYNSGTIMGYVRLDADDTFINEPGGTFEARQTSDFDAFGAGGTDLFLNQQGATVHAVAVNGTEPSFVNLERFENQGLISLQDGGVGDVFRISNTVGGTNLSFVASNGSTLGVDAFLGGPGSTADNFIVDGSVSGKTEVKVNDTNPGPGVLNKQGIPVVYVGGNVNSNAFFLKEPIDTGFFDYDLFFAPSSGGGGVFSLKSFLGQGAFVLPQLATAAQDLWADGAETWFDRTADLRVLLNGGMAPAEADSKLSESGPLPPQITPAVWVRAAGSSLDRDASAGVSAFGNSYKFNLDLEAFNFEGGIDFGKRDLLAPGDILVCSAGASPPPSTTTRSPASSI